ncbi:hypothetical protein CMI47_04940 [Candidatus Pacearchaeota archaeon]|nr:hypothetical protein [Candidatus Pacearchaeota archaeon]|tara:strand:- start:4811 stop:5266 length:456 start_codon:yes stop_codon:yes gene_type:complete
MGIRRESELDDDVGDRLVDTFLMIKPWCLFGLSDILQDFSQISDLTHFGFVRSMPSKKIREHYLALQNMPFYEDMIEDHIGKPTVIAVYRGDQRDLLSRKQKVRDRYHESIEPHSQYRRDAIHLSVNQEEFDHEFEIWRPSLVMVRQEVVV